MILTRQNGRPLWKVLLKKAVLLMLAVGLVLTWSNMGHTQAARVIERRQDPLDVLRVLVKHNVWILLDDSGSMGGDFVPGSEIGRIEVASQVLTQAVNELVDCGRRAPGQLGLCRILGLRGRH